MSPSEVLLYIILVWTGQCQGQRPGSRTKPPPPPPPPPPKPGGVVIAKCQLYPSVDNTFEDPSTSTCYYFFKVQDTYKEAVSRCERKGTRVVELGLRAEQDWLVGNICNTGACSPGNPASVWLGLRRARSGVWNWVYKEQTWSVASSRWKITPPASSAFFAALAEQSGTWRAVTGTDTAWVVCEELRPEDLTTLPPTQPPPPQVTVSTKKAVPSTCPRVGRTPDDMAISEYERLSTNAVVTELSVTNKGSRVACAKRCSQRQNCAMFMKQKLGDCYLYAVSDSGVWSDCAGDPPVCYWKTCWIPNLDVVPNTG